MKVLAAGMQVAPFWQGRDAQGLTTTPPPPPPLPGATGPWLGPEPEPGTQPAGPTPGPE